MQNKTEQLVAKSERFLRSHAVGKTFESYNMAPISGEFALHRWQWETDLYGMLDAVYILFTLGKLAKKTDRRSRQVWADRILACQDEKGCFSKKNISGHSYEHAAAYAIGALKLLAVDEEEDQLQRLRPLHFLLPLLLDYSTFDRWITHLGFRYSLRSIARKNLGWHYIWRGSHVGGGIGAVIEMAGHLFDQWWPEKVDRERWFNWYFDWLDARADAGTGYWQRAFWNRFYRQPTLIDMGGAIHFFWIYEAMKRPYPYPEQTMLSTLRLQRANGLYKDHPFCIDLDGNFCVTRSFYQLSPAKQQLYCERVYRSAERNFSGILDALKEKPLEEIYLDSHGLPGALAALVECAKLPNFKNSEYISTWQHPLDHVLWL